MSKTPPSGLRLSVIIPTRNRADIIVRNLEGLAKQLLPPQQFEVLVYDDASSDDTAARLAGLSLPYSLRLFGDRVQGGPGLARNRLIREARSNHLVILNDDALLTRAGLAIMAEALEAAAAGKVAILGKFSFPDDFQRTVMGCLLEHTNLSFRFPLMESGAVYGASAFYSCNLGIAKAAIEEAGWFDEGYIGTGAEDIELGDRLFALGHVVLYLEQCLAIHEHRLTIHDFCRAQIGRGGGGVVRCHRRPDMVFHYDAMDTPALVRLRQSLPGADAAVTRLTDAIHVLGQRAAVDPAVLADPRSIPWRDQPLTYSSHDQWRMTAEEISAEADAATTRMLGLMRQKVLNAAALGHVFQACSFLKWRYDTIGIARSPWIDDFAAGRALRLAKRAELYAAANARSLPLPGSGGGIPPAAGGTRP